MRPSWLIAPIVFIGLAGLSTWQWAPDDAWIVLACARHYLTDGVAAIHPDEALHVLSSPVWFVFGVLSALLAGPTRVESMALLQLFSALFTLIGISLFLRLIYRLPLSRSSRILGTVLLLGNPWLFRWTWAGMEVGLAVLCEALAFTLLLSRSGQARIWSASLLLGCGALIRPELMLLGAFVIPAIGWSTRRRLVFPSLAIAAPWLGWMFFAQSQWGRLMPQTASVKHAMLSAGQSVWYAMQVLLSGAGPCLAVLALSATMLWLRRRVGRRMGRTAVETRPRSSFWTRLARVGRSGSEHDRFVLVGLAWPALLVGFYAVFGYIPLSRYLVLAMPPLAVVAGLAWHGASSGRPTTGRWTAGIAVVALAFAVWITVTRVLPTSSGQRSGVYLEVAAVLDEQPDSNCLIAATEIGVLAWADTCRVLDLQGLALHPRQRPLVVDPEGLFGAAKPDWSLFKLRSEAWTLSEYRRWPAEPSTAFWLSPHDVVLYRVERSPARRETTHGPSAGNGGP